MTVVLKFLKYFAAKWLGTVAVEKVVIIFLEELAKRTDSKVDDKLIHAIFHGIEAYEECKKCNKEKNK